MLGFKSEIMKSLSCLFAKLQDDPFKNKALLFSNNAQELHPDPFQAEDPFKSDPFKGADPFKGTSFGAHFVTARLFVLCPSGLSRDWWHPLTWGEERNSWSLTGLLNLSVPLGDWRAVVLHGGGKSSKLTVTRPRSRVTGLALRLHPPCRTKISRRSSDYGAPSKQQIPTCTGSKAFPQRVHPEPHTSQE